MFCFSHFLWAMYSSISFSHILRSSSSASSTPKIGLAPGRGMTGSYRFSMAVHLYFNSHSRKLLDLTRFMQSLLRYIEFLIVRLQGSMVLVPEDATDLKQEIDGSRVLHNNNSYANSYFRSSKYNTYLYS